MPTPSPALGVPYRVSVRYRSAGGTRCTGEVTRFALSADDAKAKARRLPSVAETLAAEPLPLREFRARFLGRTGKGGGS